MPGRFLPTLSRSSSLTTPERRSRLAVWPWLALVIVTSSQLGSHELLNNLRLPGWTIRSAPLDRSRSTASEAIWPHSHVLFAAEPQGQRSPATGSANNPAIADKVVVLTNGQFLRGRLQPTPGGYWVENDQGRVLVPQETIRCTASTLINAYEIQRDAIRNPTPDDHLKLAEWCLSHNLNTSARIELRLALKQDAERTDIRKLLSRVERDLARRESPPVSGRPNAARNTTAAAGGASPLGIQLAAATGTPGLEQRPAAMESLAGLPRPVAATFTAKIQPLLINKCSTAGCHSAKGEQEFRLIPVHAGSSGHRLNTQRNLASVLQQIDLETPSQSPLLRKLTTPHGSLAGPPLMGPGAKEQEQLLRNWVKELTRHRATTHPPESYADDRGPRPRAEELASAGSRASSRPQTANSDRGLRTAASRRDSRDPQWAPTSATNVATDDPTEDFALPADELSELDGSTADSTEDIHRRAVDRDTQATDSLDEPERPAADEARRLDALLDEFEQTDAFDPETFNSRFHGPKSRRRSGISRPTR